MSRSYTFATVVCEEDFELMRLQARSFRLHAPDHLVAQIFVVENGRRVSQDSLLREYGRLADKVRFVHASDLAPIPPSVGGWWSQQVLKLLIAKHVWTDAYVALDAKNHLIAPMARKFFETSSGQLRMNGYGYKDHPLRGALERTARFVGVDSGKCVDFSWRTSTPFSFATEIVWQMIASMKQPFWKTFLDEQLTEFFLYACWTRKHWLTIPGRATYEMSQPFTKQLWDTNAGEIADLCRDAWTSGSPFFSTHRRGMAKLDVVGRAALARFWVQAGLFSETREALAII